MYYLLNTLVCFCFIFFRLIEASDSQTAFNEGLAHAEHYTTVKGDQLRYAHFKTPFEVQGSVVFVQGRGTFLEFYEAVITPLLERGLDVWMYDLSGQGGSSRLVHEGYHDQKTIQYMQHVDSFDQYVEDLHAFVEEIVVPNTSSQLILGGYSTGGHVALRYLQAKNKCHPFQRAFMISPLLALNVPLSNALSFSLQGASWFMDLETYVFRAGHEDPIFTMPFKDNPYTSDEQNFLELKKLCISNKPLVMGGVSYGWLKAAADSLSTLWSKKALLSLQIPIFIATGGKDSVVNVSYNEEFVSRLSQGYHFYLKEGRHELFRETEEIKILLWSELDKFLSNCLPEKNDYNFIDIGTKTLIVTPNLN